MLKTKIINSELLLQLAELRHGDKFMICDMGMPIYLDVPVIDLSIIPGILPFSHIVGLLSGNICVESVYIAEEMIEYDQQYFKENIVDRFGEEIINTISHEELKKMDYNFVIKTGENTPYKNVVIQSGVSF